MRMKRITLSFTVVFLLVPLAALAARTRYQVVEVTNGGAIQGKVTTSLKVKDPVIPIRIQPKEDPKETEIEKQTCGSSQQAGMYLVSPAGEVQNVLVIVEDVKKGKAAPKDKFVINNHRCRFEPLVGISYVKGEYVIKNSDPILHNTSLGKLLNSGIRRSVFNLALPYKDQVIEKKNRVSGLIDVKCDAHPWMRAHIYSSRHPYVAVTNARGTYEIKDLLPGTYHVRFWHEGFEEVVREVEVKAGAASELNVTFTKTREPAFLKRL